MPSRTVVRTIRLTSDADRQLRGDANKKDLTVSALISSVLDKYLKWDRYIGKDGLITVSRRTLTIILGYLKEEQVIELAKRLGSVTTKDMMIQHSTKSGVDGFLDVIDLLSKYEKLFEYDTVVENGTYRVILRHELGRRWSLFLVHFLEEALTNGAINSRTRMEDNSVMFILHSTTD